MSKQVLDIKQIKHLHELGLDTSKASMQYIENNNGKILCIPKEIEHDIKDVEDGYIICDTLTLQDILDLLPNKVDDELMLFIDKSKYTWRIGYADFDSEEIFEDFMNENISDAAYEMLCWLIENGYIETNKQ